MKKISVIIPVYDAEKYLSICLNSVVNQTYKNLEIIIVNDGSKDNCEHIINDYIKKYKNIKYYKKKNGGLSDARNYGLKYATGEYICFLDADDYIDKNLFSNLQKHIDSDNDMIKYKLIKIDEKYNEIERVDGPVFYQKSGTEAFNILYSSDIMIQPACLYLYNRLFLKENNFEYPIGKFHEDFARTVLIMLKAKKVTSSDVFGYYYYQSTSSITRGNNDSKKMKRALDMLEHYDYMIEKIKSYNLDKITEDNLKIYYTNCIILKTEELSKQDRKKYVREIKKRKMLKNIKVRDIRQLLKKVILNISIEWYLKLR